MMRVPPHVPRTELRYAPESEPEKLIIVTSNDIIAALAKPPQISMRTDTMRAWTRPGESVSESESSLRLAASLDP